MHSNDEETILTLGGSEGRITDHNRVIVSLGLAPKDFIVVAVRKGRRCWNKFKHACPMTRSGLSRRMNQYRNACLMRDYSPPSLDHFQGLKVRELDTEIHSSFKSSNARSFIPVGRSAIESMLQELGAAT